MDRFCLWVSSSSPVPPPLPLTLCPYLLFFGRGLPPFACGHVGVCVCVHVCACVCVCVRVCACVCLLPPAPLGPTTGSRAPTAGPGKPWGASAPPAAAALASTSRSNGRRQRPTPPPPPPLPRPKLRRTVAATAVTVMAEPEGAGGPGPRLPVAKRESTFGALVSCMCVCPPLVIVNPGVFEENSPRKTPATIYPPKWRGPVPSFCCWAA